MSAVPTSSQRSQNNISTVSRDRGATPQAPADSWWLRLWRPFWTLPTACVALALVIGTVLPQLEPAWGIHDLRYFFQGGADGARELLGTIASAMISVTGLVFSITIVVLQLASSQFTPRAIGSFLQNRIVQCTLGVFIATFVFALTVIRYVHGSDGTEEFVPQVSVTFAFVLVLVCMGLFLAFIHYITTSIQVSRVLTGIGTQTLQSAIRLYPDRIQDNLPQSGQTWSPALGTPRIHVDVRDHGTITYLNYTELVRWAQRHEVVIVVERQIGDFLTDGQRILTVWGIAELSEANEKTLRGYLRVGSERDISQDVAFGIRQLVDIADRALSPGVNDPTTAVESLNELHRVLRHLVQQAIPSPYIVDIEGNVRVVHHPQEISELLGLALDEITHYGRDTVQIPKQLRLVLNDLLEVSADRYTHAIQEKLDTVPENTVR